MPIVDVEIVRRPGEVQPPDLAKAIADHVGEIFRTPVGTTWVKLRWLLSENYAENATTHELAFFPVFVTILKASQLERSALQEEITLLTRALAILCQRPEQNVHILYLPPAAGRIAFGGKLIPPE